LSESSLKEKLHVIISMHSKFSHGHRLKFINTSTEPCYFCVWFFLFPSFIFYSCRDK